jgi:hypothetical protein
LGTSFRAATSALLAAGFSLRCATASAAPEEDQTRTARRVIDEENRRVQQGTYAHPYLSLALGRGLRLNNPYRLEKVLGDSPEGLSLSALYLDLGAGWLMGNPRGLQHGPVANLSVAVTGIRQEVLSPGYRILVRLGPRWSLSGKLAVPVVLEPDLGGGGELGVAGLFRVLAGVAAYAELLGSTFLGAATYEADTTVIPIVSLQAGLWTDHEVLP